MLKIDLDKLDTDLKKQQTDRDDQIALRAKKESDLAKLVDLQASSRSLRRTWPRRSAPPARS